MMIRTVLFSLIVLFFISSPLPVQALMTPDGQMVQMKEYDDSEVLVKAEKFPEAIEKLKALLREEPAHANAWNLLGFSQRMTGDFDAAEKSYNNALTITPNHLGALNYMGQMFVQTGRMEQARSFLDRLNAACGDDCVEYQQLAKAVQEGKAGNY